MDLFLLLTSTYPSVFSNLIEEIVFGLSPELIFLQILLDIIHVFQPLLSSFSKLNLKFKVLFEVKAFRLIFNYPKNYYQGVMQIEWSNVVFFLLCNW